jgi:hypothetical protein
MISDDVSSRPKETLVERGHGASILAAAAVAVGTIDAGRSGAEAAEAVLAVWRLLSGFKDVVCEKLPGDTVIEGLAEVPVLGCSVKGGNAGSVVPGIYGCEGEDKTVVPVCTDGVGKQVELPVTTIEKGHAEMPSNGCAAKVGNAGIAGPVAHGHEGKAEAMGPDGTIGLGARVDLPTGNEDPGEMPNPSCSAKKGYASSADPGVLMSVDKARTGSDDGPADAGSGGTAGQEAIEDGGIKAELLGDSTSDSGTSSDGTSESVGERGIGLVTKVFGDKGYGFLKAVGVPGDVFFFTCGTWHRMMVTSTRAISLRSFWLRARRKAGCVPSSVSSSARRRAQGQGWSPSVCRLLMASCAIVMAVCRSWH